MDERNHRWEESCSLNLSTLSERLHEKGTIFHGLAAFRISICYLHLTCTNSSSASKAPAQCSAQNKQLVKEWVSEYLSSSECYHLSFIFSLQRSIASLEEAVNALTTLLLMFQVLIIDKLDITLDFWTSFITWKPSFYLGLAGKHEQNCCGVFPMKNLGFNLDSFGL